MEEYKTCTKCGQTKFLNAFYASKRYKNGYRPQCKRCLNDASRYTKSFYYLNNQEAIKSKVSSYRADNKDLIASSKKEWQKSNPDKVLAYATKRRKLMGQNGIFYVSRSEIQKLYRSPCFNCGSSDRIEIDHVIPISRGGTHSIGNLLPLCKSCNASKGNKTFTEWAIAKRRKRK